jgi:hypothetical protein
MCSSLFSSCRWLDVLQADLSCGDEPSGLAWDADLLGLLRSAPVGWPGRYVNRPAVIGRERFVVREADRDLAVLSALPVG